MTAMDGAMATQRQRNGNRRCDGNATATTATEMEGAMAMDGATATATAMAEIDSNGHGRRNGNGRHDSDSDCNGGGGGGGEEEDCVFLRDLPVGVVLIATMACRDGRADLVRRRLGSTNKWFFNRSKPEAGSMVFVAGSFVTSFGLISWLTSTGAMDALGLSSEEEAGFELNV